MNNFLPENSQLILLGIQILNLSLLIVSPYMTTPYEKILEKFALSHKIIKNKRRKNG